LPKTNVNNEENKPMGVYEWLGHRVCFCWFYRRFDQYSQKSDVHVDSATSHGHHLFFTDFFHGLGTLTESYILETMGGYTTQPRIVFYNQQTSLSMAFEFFFKTKYSKTCLV
jgi:hypothetical protein